MQPSIGQIVHYQQDANSPTLPAIVTGRSQNDPDLAVFTHDGQIGVVGCDAKCWRPVPAEKGSKRK